MKKIKEWLYDNAGILVYIILLVIVLAILIGYGCILVEYGDKPINEIPAWVLWLMFQNR